MPSMEDAILIGGPRDGKRITVSAEASTVEAAMIKPVPPPKPHPPRPPWWRFIRRRRWRPAPPPEPLEMIQLTYRADGTRADGLRVFRLAGEWQPYRGPDADMSGNLYNGLVGAMYAVHPMIRQDRDTRWVMDSGWYKRVRALAEVPADEDSDPDEWEPNPDDMLLGLRISVTEDGGRPHLENPRHPADSVPAV